MPVRVAVPIRPLESEDFRRLDFRVMKHAFDCQNSLGRLADEEVYKNDLALLLSENQFGVDREVKVEVAFGDFVKPYFLDVVVDQRGVYELKVVRKLTAEHRHQLLHYLRLIDCPRGKLVNFGGTSVESEFVNAGLSLDERQRFVWDRTNLDPLSPLYDLVEPVLRDLGTGLNLSLYSELFKSQTLPGLPDAPLHTMVPMSRWNNPLGSQRFVLTAPDRAMRLTAFRSVSDGYQEQLRKLIRPTPLHSLDWINISLTEVTATTIQNH